MKLSSTDPIRELLKSVQDIEDGVVNIHTEERSYEKVIVMSVTEAYIAFDDPDDLSACSWVVLPWHRVLSVNYISPHWIDPA